MIQSSSQQMIPYFPPSNPSINLPALHLTRFLTDYQQLTPNSWDERKQRRMISNRESARRSRMRKQRHLNELWSQVVRLTTQNQCLIDKLNQMSDNHDRVVRENVKLKEEAARLKTKITDLQLANSFSIFTDDSSSSQSVENFLTSSSASTSLYSFINK